MVSMEPCWGPQGAAGATGDTGSQGQRKVQLESLVQLAELARWPVAANWSDRRRRSRSDWAASEVGPISSELPYSNGDLG